MDLQEIGLFQFENLVRNQIPFTLINLGLNLDSRYPSHIQSFLQRQTHHLKSAEVLDFIKKNTSAQENAIVIVSTEIIDAKNTAKGLFNAGFENVYYLNEVYS